VVKIVSEFPLESVTLTEDQTNQHICEGCGKEMGKEEKE
jgi:hypothetical protein